MNRHPIPYKVDGKYVQPVSPEDADTVTLVTADGRHAWRFSRITGEVEDAPHE